MKNLILGVIAILGFVCPNFAQFTTVTYDLDRNWFNEGQPLPAEKAMIFKGALPAGTEMVELLILSSNKRNELYKATWTKTNTADLSLIVPYKLRSSADYDITLRLFNALPAKEQEKLIADLQATLDAYIDANLSEEKAIKFTKKKKKIIKDLNVIIAEHLGRYRVKTSDWNIKLSEVIKLKLEQLERAKLSKEYVKGDSTTTEEDVRKHTRKNLVGGLKNEINREVSRMLGTDIFVLNNTRLVDDYPTESKENAIALNVGYGGVYLSGELDNFSYGASPYLGIAFPLGNSVLGSKFLGNTSVTLGVFLDNFEDEKGNGVTGFLINRPIYLGLDHKLFKFIRVNAGATFLEGLNVSDTPGVEPTKSIMIRPYIGLSARIDLSIRLGR